MTKKHDILLVADEIQSGFGRTGTLMFTEQYAGIDQADCIIFAKGVANGLPLAGIATRQNLGRTQPALTQGGTYAGNAVACAAANAVCDVFRGEGKVGGLNILETVRARSAQLFKGLLDITQKHNVPVTELRGRGLMIGMEFEPVNQGCAGAFKDACLKRNFLVSTAGKFETMRLIPPLTVSEAQVRDSLAIMEEAMIEVFGPNAAKPVVSKKVVGFTPDGALPGSDVPLRWTTNFQ